MARRQFNPFENVALKAVKGSNFDLSHDLKTAFDPGRLVPVLSMECVPGDEIRINIENMYRFAPLIAPVMHKMRVKTQFFFVPNRLLWDDWEDWILGESVETHPYIEFGNVPDVAAAGFEIATIADYLGYPTGPARWVRMNALPIYAYYKIYADWYRDQNLETDNVYDDFKAVAGNNFFDGATSFRTLSLLQTTLYANWERDYFTACLPTPQAGDPVLIPLFSQGATTDVIFQTNDTDTAAKLRRPNGTNLTDEVSLETDASAFLTGSTSLQRAALDPNGTLVLNDTINFAAATINDLRLANVTQEFLERQIRAGNTYKDFIYSNFQTKTKDERLQRAEFLGSVNQNMLISEVLSTAETETLPQGTMAGHGISVASTNSVNYNVTEHGWLIGITYAVPDTAYYQGLHKSLSKFDRFDYLTPVFANVGEQPVRKKELYIVDSVLPPDIDTNEEEFGYLPIYSEYRFLNSRVAGDMRDSLDFWHWARKFEEQPSLNAEFTKAADVPLRTFAVQEASEQKIWAHIFFDIKAYRKLPKYGIPTL